MVSIIIKENATRAQLEATDNKQSKSLRMAGWTVSNRRQMCLSHVGLKFVLPTEGFVALWFWTFE
jgi:hypothetical protein